MLIPALDLIDGRVVRLHQGDFAKQTDFSLDPVEQAQHYASQGAEFLHLVDLDGARDPKRRQTQLLADICVQSGLPCQVGGGLREQGDLEQLFEAGVERAVIGSTAVSQPDLVRHWFAQYGGDAIVLALDVNIDSGGQAWVATHGWQTTSDLTLDAALERYLDAGCQHVLCTDISKDGTLEGANLELYKNYKQRYPQVRWQASGGVASLDELTRLKQAQCDSVILGKSLLTGKFTLEEALQCWQNA